MTAPVLKPVGDSLFIVHQERAVFEFSRLSEHGDSLSAEVAVTNAANAELHWARVNLASTQGRGALIRALEEAEPAGDWRQLVDVTCRMVARHVRTGEPAVPLLAEAPATDTRWAVQGWMPAGQITVLFGDGGCIAADTRVATSQGAVRVDQLAGSAMVWALGLAGPVLAPALVFPKGYCRLLRISLSDGRSITVTPEHRFLTARGWRPASTCAVGEALAGAPDPPRSMPGSVPEAWWRDGPSSRRTVADSRARYWTGHRRYDPPPPWIRGGGQAPAPSPADARARSLTLYGEDASATSPARSRLDQRPDRLARSSFAPVALWRLGAEYLPASWRATRHCGCTPAPSPCRRDCESPPWPESSPSATAAAVALFSSPSVYHATIIAITEVRPGPYWDLQVPGYENYLANGLWHHNSGKSYLALSLALSGLLDRAISSRWRLAPIRRALYLDWESDRAEQQARLWRLTAGLGSCPVDGALLHRTMRRPLKDEIVALRAEVARQEVDFIVCDSLAPASGPEPEHADAALTALLALRSLAVTVLCIAHVSKQQADSKAPARPYGSVHISNLARSVIEARGSEADDQEESTVSLYHRKSNQGRRQPPSALRFSFDSSGAIRVGSGDPDTGGAGLAWQVLDALRNGRRDTSVLAEELDCSPGTLRSVLARLEKRGAVIKFGEPGPGRGKKTEWARTDTNRDEKRGGSATTERDDDDRVPF